MINPGMEQQKPNKPLPECAQGPEASQRFADAMSKLLTVPRAVLMERENAYRKQVDANPRRRGRKRKAEVMAQQELLSKLQDQKRGIDNALVDVQTEILKRKLSGRRSRQA